MAGKKDEQAAQATSPLPPAAGTAVGAAGSGAVEKPGVVVDLQALTPEQFQEFCTVCAANLQGFLHTVHHVFASVLANIEVRVREGGEERPATAEDVLAISIKEQGRVVVIVTNDGQKYTLIEGVLNEA